MFLPVQRLVGISASLSVASSVEGRLSKAISTKEQNMSVDPGSQHETS